MRALLTALKSLREEERLARALQKELRGMAGKVTGKEGGGGGGGGEEEEDVYLYFRNSENRFNFNISFFLSFLHLPPCILCNYDYNYNYNSIGETEGG